MKKKECEDEMCCGFHRRYTGLQASAMPCGIADWGQVLIQIEGKYFNLFGQEELVE